MRYINNIDSLFVLYANMRSIISAYPVGPMQYYWEGPRKPQNAPVWYEFAVEYNATLSQQPFVKKSKIYLNDRTLLLQ